MSSTLLGVVLALASCNDSGESSDPENDAGEDRVWATYMRDLEDSKGPLEEPDST